MKTKTNVLFLLVFGIAVMTILGTIGMVSAHMFLGKNSRLQPLTPKVYNQTFVDQVQLAISNKDFETWRSLMISQLTQENFKKEVSIWKNISAYQNEKGSENFSMRTFPGDIKRNMRPFLNENNTSFPRGAHPMGQHKRFNIENSTSP